MLDQAICTTSGVVNFRRLLPDDQATIHSWVTDPSARFWDELDSTPGDVATEINRLSSSYTEAGWIIQRADIPLALVEVYDPTVVVLNDREEIHPGDIGMHLLCAPRTDGAHESGLTSALMAAAVTWIFNSPFATEVIGGKTPQRIVVEPDVRNGKILAKNAAAGFRTIPGCESVTLPDKNARLQSLTRDQLAHSPLGQHAFVHSPTPQPGYLAVESIEAIQRQFLAKTLRELIHERLLQPVADPAVENAYSVSFGGSTITFTAIVHPLEHYSIDPNSLSSENGRFDVVDLIANAAPDLGIPPEFTHTYLEEINATLAGRARAAAGQRPTAAELADAATTLDPATYLQYMESAMVEGHPSFIANSGRCGMSEEDVYEYVPELGHSTHLVWCAARRSACTVASTSSTDVEALIDSQLPNWRETLEARGYDSDLYVPFPIHPWQWSNKITTVFASNIMKADLVLLGSGPDVMHPQQSLRTLFNLSRPDLPYVKTAVAVRNMGFTRGLSPKYMADTPAINEWVGSKLDNDEDFQRFHVRLLKEVASIGFHADAYHRSAAAGVAKDGPHQKMLAALWRESPIPLLRDGNSAVTLAAVLHLDAQGSSLAAEWIRRSGVPAQQWVRALLNVYLRPAIRALAEYDIAFMLHSENIILEMDNWVPVGSFFKDIGEEVALLRADVEVPDSVSRIRVTDDNYRDEQRTQCIHTDIVDGVLRHLGAILSHAGVLSDEDFWAEARRCVTDYWRDYPESGRNLPLLAPTFMHSCLNRLQLRNPQTIVDLENQEASMLYAGRLNNPMA